MTEEIWSEIPGFSNYTVSNFGRVHHTKRARDMQISYQVSGHAKISLIDDHGERRTRSVAFLVAEAFLERPTSYCDHVIVKDGKYWNLAAWNLAWRPRGFAFLYLRQLTAQHPAYYRSLPVRNVSHPAEYKNVIDAGVSEGRLFDDVWRSTWTGDHIFPYHSLFRVITERV